MKRISTLHKLEDSYQAYEYRQDYVFSESGMEIKVPMVYKGATSSMYLLTANRDRVLHAIGDKRIQPVSILGGKTLVAINTFEYRDCEAGPFTEFTFSVPVMVGAKIAVPIIPLLADQLFSKFGFYVIQLGASNFNAREHIKGIWGYPTYDTDLDISISENNESLRSSVYDQEQLIYKVEDSFSSPKALSFSKKQFHTYFHAGEEVRHVTLDTFLVGSTRVGDGKNITIEFGSHPLSRKILDLEPGAVMAAIYYPNAIEIAGSYETL